MTTPSLHAAEPSDDDSASPARFGARRIVPTGLNRSPSSAVAHRLLDLLLGESMRPGDRLPGERALAEELGVGRSAVREAISALEVLGVVETRAGSGTYLRSGTSELLPSTLSWSLLMDQERTAELSVVRGALERSAAQLAALTATAEQKAELTGIVEDQRAAADDPEGYVAADVAFHRVLAQIGGNALVGELLATTRTLLRVWFERSVDNREDIDRAILEHGMIAEAVAAGDAAAAGMAMEQHMATAAERLLRDTTPSA
ncbi:MAG: FadR/GntR family transcriptional regulator [Brachybacterium tyrofermentans]|uniref:FadR/GntR family transcriptional regulator n=1 Tax=Brachybacterium tyrofermentans TaxID=47848 RepID=A0ABW0FH38_9MICO|nr:FCD domain-containing protein [Brachybacterium tyrofermentans]SLM95870.1 Transcriptional regulator, GntR family [Corynebacterium xerosis]